jgi:membrane protein required for colicin V production
MTPLALDLTIGFIILLSTLVAYFRGIVREFFMLAGLALAALAAYKLGHVLEPEVGNWIKAHAEGGDEKAKVLGLLTPDIATKVIAYGGVFLSVFVVMILIRMMISHWVSGAGLTLADRLGGAAFGFARGFLLVLVVFATCFFMGYQGDPEKLPEWAKNSVSVPVLQNSLAWTDKNVDLRGSLKNVGDKIQQINFDKVGTSTNSAVNDLKEAVKREEAEIQKAPEMDAAPVEPVIGGEPMPTSPMPDITPPPSPEPAAAGKGPTP